MRARGGEGVNGAQKDWVVNGLPLHGAPRRGWGAGGMREQEGCVPGLQGAPHFLPPVPNTQILT